MTSKLPFLTLDKSYLQSCTDFDLAALSQSCRFVLPEALVYEVVKHSPEARAKLFRKFPSGPEPYTVAHDISRMLRDEMSSKQPYTHENIAHRDLSIHERLASPSFEMNESMNAAVAKKRDEVDEDMEPVLHLAEILRDRHPDAFRGSAAAQAEKQAALKLEICSQPYVRREYTDTMRSRPVQIATPVPEHLLTAEWANFRWFQVIGLFALTVALKYPDQRVLRSSPKSLMKLNHDVLDCQGMLTALVVGGGFAVQEKKWMPLWKLLNPEGPIVSKPRAIQPTHPQ